LDREKKSLNNVTSFEYHWGERAKHEIDKEAMITFLAEVKHVAIAVTHPVLSGSRQYSRSMAQTV